MRFTLMILRLTVVVGGMGLVAPSPARADFLLEDDFNDNSLDATKWRTALPFGDSSVREQNQRLELANRGYLVTQSQFNPGVIGGLRIRGQYTFTNATFPGHDNFQIVTRTTGTPGGGSAEVTSGIAFEIFGDDSLRITDRTNGQSLAGKTSIPIGDNESFDFEIRDDGLNLFFSVREIGGDGSFASLVATSALVSAVNRVAFYNRESNNGGISTLGFLDNVRLDVVPEPSTLALFGIGAFGMLALPRVRRLAGGISRKV